MGKALFGSLYVHPPLTDSEARELEQMELGELSLRIHEERDALTAWPAFDEGEDDVRTLVAQLRSWNKSVFMNAFVYADSGGEGQEWLIVDDDLQSYYFGSGEVPEYIKPWLSGVPPRIRSRVPLDALQRLTAHALRLASTTLELESFCDELAALGDAVADRAHANALLDELHAIACSDFELSKAHWLDWRVRVGVLGVMIARVAFPESLDVPKSDFEDYNLTQGWLRTHGRDVAPSIGRLLMAASRLDRRAATALLLDYARDLDVKPEPAPLVLTLALERTVEDYGPGYGFLLRSFGVAGVTRLLPDLVQGLRDYEGDADRAELRTMLEWHAFVCRDEEGELFSATLEREPELEPLADAGAAQCG